MLLASLDPSKYSYLAITNPQRDPECQHWYLITLCLQENKEGAIEDCTEAIDLNPNYLKAWLRRAHIYEDTDKPHESMKDFEKVLELDPRHAESNVAVRVVRI